MTRFYLVQFSDSGVVHEIRASSPEDAADRVAPRNRGSETEFHDVWVARRPHARNGKRPEPRESMSVTTVVQPKAPRCDGSDGHDWDDAPVRGSGGGICYTETCQTCGVTHTVDTWGRHPVNGSQGWRIETYE